MKKSTLTLAIIIIATVSVFAQSVTETRKIKTKALEIFEKYSGIMANLYNGNVYNENKFLELFRPESYLYNDILPNNAPQELSAKEYFDKFMACVKMNYAEYQDLDFEFPSLIGNNWEINCTFTKKLRFKTDNEYYPQHIFHYTMTIEIDTSFENAKILGIEVSNPVDDYIIIENRTNSLILDKDSIEIVDYDTLSGIKSKLFPNQYKIDDFKVIWKEENPNYFYQIEKRLEQKSSNNHFYIIDDFDVKKNILGIGFNFSPLAFGNKINVDKFEEISLKSNALNLSFFGGKQIAHKKYSTWFFNYGLDFNRYFYEYNGTNQTEFPMVDTDGDSYLRKIQINNLKEKINSFSISIPLSFQLIQQISKNKKNPFFFSIEIGAFAEYTLSSISNYNINADYHGLYDYYGGIEFDHYYDFGNFDQSSKQTLATVKDLRYNLGAFGKIGLCIALNKSNLMKFDIVYKQSFISPLKYNNNYVLSEDNKSYNTLLQSTKQGMQNLYFGLSWLKTINAKIKQNKK